MLAHLAHHAALGRPNRDGVTTRDVLMAKATRGDRRARSQLHGPRFPESLRYLQAWFIDLSAARPLSGMGGIAALTYEGIIAWARLTGERPQPHEVDAIMQMDRVWRSAMSVPSERDDSSNTSTGVINVRPGTGTWPSKKSTTPAPADLVAGTA